ncbi:unnamed protein product [Larinioides sclopetarius]|uniref:Uncharacterized protein n=1 Tax=Larinioides sclopetarius TaxID=280406 RepID=A0AAV1YXY2_9ARAC
MSVLSDQSFFLPFQKYFFSQSPKLFYRSSRTDCLGQEDIVQEACISPSNLLDEFNEKHPPPREAICRPQSIRIGNKARLRAKGIHFV